MALVDTNKPPQVSLSSVDNNRRPASTGFYLPQGLTLAQYGGFLTLARGPYLALTQNRLLGASVAFGFREDAPIAVIPKSAESERKLLLVFDVDNGRGTVTQEIPAPSFDIEVDGNDEVPLDDPLVAAYANVIVSGAIGPNNGVVNKYGLQITSLLRATMVHQTSSRRR